MYKTLLVPLDGSAFSERALPLAATIARAAGARIVLVHTAWGKPGTGKDVASAEERTTAEAESYLNGAAARLAVQNIPTGISAPFAPPAAGILKEIADSAADLVVMCTHGRSGIGRVLYGSVAEAVIAKSPAPVLLVHPTGPIADLAPSAAAPVVVPLDGSTLSEASLPYALDMARALACPLVLLRVVVPNAGYYPDPMLGQPYVSDVGERIIHEQQAEAESYLQRIARDLNGDVVIQSLVRVGWPSESIVYEARSAGAGLIVMATHGHTGLADMLMGNVALDVLRRSGLPLLLVRPRDLAAKK